MLVSGRLIFFRWVGNHQLVDGVVEDSRVLLCVCVCFFFSLVGGSLKNNMVAT